MPSLCARLRRNERLRKENCILWVCAGSIGHCSNPDCFLNLLTAANQTAANQTAANQTAANQHSNLSDTQVQTHDRPLPGKRLQSNRPKGGEHAFNIAPNHLQQDFTESGPNQKWVGDITNVGRARVETDKKTVRGTVFPSIGVYAPVITDLFFRRMVALRDLHANPFASQMGHQQPPETGSGDQGPEHGGRNPQTPTGLHPPHNSPFSRFASKPLPGNGIHQRLLQPAPQTLSLGPKITRGLRTKGRLK